MKQFLLFAGTDAARADGVNGSSETSRPQPTPFCPSSTVKLHRNGGMSSTLRPAKSSSAVHIRTSNGMIGFQRSDRVVGTHAKKLPISTPISATTQKAADHLNGLEADVRAVATTGAKNGNGHANGHVNGHANGGSAEG